MIETSARSRASAPLYNQGLASVPDAMVRNENSTVRRVNLALLSLTAVWCICWFFHARHYWEDDAYIHLEFARSVAQGRGFAFNGRVVAGDTAPLWVLFLVAIHAFLVKWMVAGKVATVLGAAAGFSGIYAFALRMARALPPTREASIFPAAIVLLVAANPYTCYWIFSGMEPLAAAGAACWAVLLSTCEAPSATSFLSACLIAGCGPLLRPEMALLAGLLGPPLLGQWRRLRRTSGAGTLALGLILFCAPVAAWSAYSLHAFGQLLPNTNAAKRAASGDSVVRHLLLIYAAGFPLVLAGVAGAAVYLAVRAKVAWRSFGSAARGVWTPAHQLGSPAAAWIVVLWALLATVFYVADHSYVQTRYILTTAPALLVVIFAAALTAGRSAARALYAFSLVAGLAVSFLVARPLVRNKAFDGEVTAELASYIRDQLPPGAPVATYSIGELGFLSQHPIIDTGGITRPEVIPYLEGPQEQVIRWAQSEGAEYFVGSQPQPNALLVHRSVRRYAAWTAHLSSFEEWEPLELWKLQPLR